MDDDKKKYYKENPPVKLKSKAKLAAEKFKAVGGDPKKHHKKYGGPITIKKK